MATKSALPNISRILRRSQSAIGNSSSAKGAVEESEAYLKPSEQNDFVEGENLDIFSLSRLDVKKLLQVAPVIQPLVKENLEVPFVPSPTVDISAAYRKVYGLK